MGKRVSQETYDKKIEDLNIRRLENLINLSTKIRHECKICNHIWDVRPSHLYNEESKCPKCYFNSNTKTNEEYDIELKLKRKDITRVGQYIKHSIKIEHKCTACGLIFKAAPNTILSGKCRCPSCYGGYKFDNESYDQRLLELNVGVVRVEDFKGTKVKIKYKCIKCDSIYKIYPDSLLYQKYNCKMCSSQAQAKKTDIEYKRELKFKNK